MAKAAFSKKKTLFTSKLDLNLRKKVIKCCIWSVTVRTFRQFLAFLSKWKVNHIKKPLGGNMKVSET